MTTFKCWDDCTEVGCPSHEIECRIQSSVMLLHFKEDGRDNLLISEKKFRAMIEAYFETIATSASMIPVASLHITCPFDGQKWSLHTQEQLNMFARHLAVHATPEFDGD